MATDQTQPTPGTASEILKRARRLTQTTQAELAQRAQVHQSVISHYERGFRVPTVDTLERLLAAAGLSLTWGLTHAPAGSGPLRTLSGPIGRRVRASVDAIAEELDTAGLTDVRVIGDVASGTDTTWSELVLVSDPAPEKLLKPLEMMRLRGRISALTGAYVQLCSPAVARAQNYTDDDIAAGIRLRAAATPE